MKPQQTKPEPEPRADVEVGDHLYVHHQGQPCTGVVRAHGRHGVTVRIGSKDHKVHWGRVLGHKSRIAQRYSVVDQGVDGMLVEDAQGRRRFIGVPNESKEDPMIAKSLGAQRPVLLFRKSMPPRPGLQQQQITDKNGVQSKRWMRVDAGAAPAQKGQHVGFENGEHKGHGQVTASGRDGVTVRDGAGGDHRIPHGKVTHHWQGDGAPDASPHDQPAGDGDAGAQGAPADANNDSGEPASADDISRALFNTSEIDKLPKTVDQPAHSWEELETKAKVGLKEYTKLLDGVAKQLGLVTGKRPESLDFAQENENEKAAKEGRKPVDLSETDYMLPEHWDDDRGYLFMGPLKGKARAEEKVEKDYDGDWSQLRDMVRATIAVPSLLQVPKVLADLKAAGLELAQQPKNNLVKPLPGGYRDVNLILLLPNGMLAEMQVHVKPMTLAKEKGHKPYEVTRSIEAKYKKDGVKTPKEEWSEEDRAAHGKAMSEQEKIYGPAWDKATAGIGARKKEAEKQPLAKSSFPSKIVLWKFAGERDGK